MKIWKHSPWDSLLLLYSIGQGVVMIALAASWAGQTWSERAGSAILLVLLQVYNIIIVSHLFTHTPWFERRWLNRLVSMLNSINIGQSIQAYQFDHVRNHHLHNNDCAGEDGRTLDRSSTYLGGERGDHVGLFRYAICGAVETVWKEVRHRSAVTRLWRVGEQERDLLSSASKTTRGRQRELRQIRLDRLAQVAALLLFLSLSWQWVLFCYLPSFFLALAVVNIQNYYEHYGARPGDPYANSVSHYGIWYNRLTFNDGYHQEHHLRPYAHWSQMPRVREQLTSHLESVERIVSPVPAIVGFLDRRRPLLHRDPAHRGELSPRGKPRGGPQPAE